MKREGKLERPTPRIRERPDFRASRASDQPAEAGRSWGEKILPGSERDR